MNILQHCTKIGCGTSRTAKELYAQIQYMIGENRIEEELTHEELIQKSPTMLD